MSNTTIAFVEDGDVTGSGGLEMKMSRKKGCGK